MFKDDYRECNESIKADPVLVENIIRQTKRKRPIRKRSFLQRAASVAAAFLVLISSITLVYNSILKDDYITGLKSYNEVYTVLQAMTKRELLNGIRDINWAVSDSDMKAGDVPEYSGDNSNTAKDVDYSDTNLQVLGVQEADIVKTDGRYIYAISEKYVYIVAVDGENLSVLSKIERMTDNSAVQELYVTENRLILIKSVTLQSSYDGEKPYMDSYYYRYSYSNTAADIYDISDRANPKLMNSLGQNGYYISSRMIDDVLYMVTNHYIYTNTIVESDPSTYIPSLYSDDKSTLIKASDICIAPSPSIYSYLIVTGADTQEPGKHVSVKSIFGSGSTIYASLENLYVATYSYRDNTSGTDIIKFSLDKGNIEVTGTGYVPGNLINQFAMDEYKGYFRICTTSSVRDVQFENGVNTWWSSTTVNNVFVLNDKLEIVGKIQGLAKGESIYSVRFDGDIGYFVTFRRTDPLFAVDLSNPKAPKLLSELKIPGFSNYLHMFKENLLFGFGMDADPETGFATELKLSMFDVSDKKNITEKHILKLGSRYTFSEAQYNHKAILISPDRNLIGIYSTMTSEYLLFSYNEETGFEKVATLTIENSYDRYNYYYYYNTRGLYINDCFYVVTDRKIEVYSLDTFEKLNTLILTNN